MIPNLIPSTKHLLARKTSVVMLAAWLPLLALPGDAQQQRPNPEAYYRAPGSVLGKTVVLPIGTTFEGRIDSTIGSAHSRQGETFTISMSAPVLANGTDVLIPAGSQVLGEVVEAIPSGHVQHMKGYPKPIGKLRVQLTGLRTPDGVSYPMVASLAGENVQAGPHNLKPNSLIGPGIGYVGSSSSFDAVAPGMADRMRNQHGGPQVVTRQKLMSDPIYGMDRSMANTNQKQAIRSLVHQNRELVIHSGSPVTVKLESPFKIGIAPPPAAMDTMAPPVDSSMTGGHRFAPTGSGDTTMQESQPAAENPLPGILPDVPHSSTVPAPPPVQQQPPYQQPASPPQNSTGNSSSF